MEANSKEPTTKKLPKRLLVKIAAHFDLDPRTVEARFNKGTDPIVTHQDTIAIIKAYYAASTKKGMEKLGIVSIAPSTGAVHATGDATQKTHAKKTVRHDKSNKNNEIAERKPEAASAPVVAPPLKQEKPSAPENQQSGQRNVGLRPKIGT